MPSRTAATSTAAAARASTAVSPSGAPTLFIDGRWIDAAAGDTFEAEGPGPGREPNELERWSAREGA